jgi:hypothetical protein
MLQRLRAVAVIVIVLSALPVAAGEKERSQPSRPAARAPSFFETVGATSIPEFLGRIRPAPLSPALRAQVLASLPREGELQPTAAERAKLAALEPVLDLHGRKGTVEIKVIDVGHAFEGLHARTVLLLSRGALALVTPEELQALTGHELGHESLWNEYQAAMAAGAHPRMQELELICDGIAVMSLRAARPGPGEPGHGPRQDDALQRAAGGDRHRRIVRLARRAAQVHPGPVRAARKAVPRAFLRSQQIEDAIIRRPARS